MSSEARSRLWDVLGPSLLSETVPPEAARKLDVFAAQHGVEPGDLARAIKAARSLLRGAAKLKLQRDAFQLDLSLLAAGEGAKAALLGQYEEAVIRLRRQAAIDEIANHGKLLTDVDWRVDRIGDTKKAKSLDVDLPPRDASLPRRRQRTHVHVPGSA